MREVRRCILPRYIPLLAEVDPEYFAVSVTTIDGRQFSLGHDDVAFSIQSCSKPISYIMAMEQFGTEYLPSAATRYHRAWLEAGKDVGQVSSREKKHIA